MNFVRLNSISGTQHRFIDLCPAMSYDQIRIKVMNRWVRRLGKSEPVVVGNQIAIQVGAIIFRASIDMTYSMMENRRLLSLCSVVLVPFLDFSELVVRL